MDATMTAVKEYLEFWLTKRTADVKKAHEEQLSTVKVSADLPCDQCTAVQCIARGVQSRRGSSRHPKWRWAI